MASVLDQILEAGSFEEVQRIVENSTDKDFNSDFLTESNGPEPTDFSETDNSMKDLDKSMGLDSGGSSSKKTVNPNDDKMESAMLTEQELADIYTECVAEVIRESKAKINEKYKKKKADAKKFKAKKLADKKKQKDDELDIMSKKDKKGVKEGAVNEIMDQIFSQF